MRIVFAIRAGAVGLALSIAAASSNASGASVVSSGHRPFVVPGAAPHRHAGRIRPLDRCSGNVEPLGYLSFIGGGIDVSVPGAESGMLAGGYNQICANLSAIGAGEDNQINAGIPDKSGSSFIGAGIFNQVSGGYSFIGAGGFADGSILLGGNTVAGIDAFIGAGEDNQSTGNGSFIGAGGFQSGVDGDGPANFVSGTDSFLGAGDANGVGAREAFEGGGYFNTIEPGAGGINGGAYSAVVAGSYNSIAATAAATAQYSFIGAGSTNSISGASSSIAAGNGNRVLTDVSSIGGGTSNTITAKEAFIGGGLSNGAAGGDSMVGAGAHNNAAGIDSMVAAGFGNLAFGNGSFVGGGGYGFNLKTATSANVSYAVDSFIGAGDANLTLAAASSIGAGQGNSINGPAGFIGAGIANTISKNGTYAAIAGGRANTAGGLDSFVPGGYANVANGMHSFAGGTGSQAIHTGTFVWSDDAVAAKTLKSSAADQFLVRASGGVTFYSNPTLITGVKLAPGGGSWGSVSDRDSKTAIVPLDSTAVLAKVRALPLSEWSYRSEDSSIRHVGPMAQDFFAAFRVGEDDRHITTIDEDGVALAAIQGLAAEGKRKDLKVAALEIEVRELTARAAKIEATVAALSARAKR